MSYLSLFIISFTIALSGAMAPGPLLGAVIAASARQGFKSGPLILIGHALVEVLLVGVILMGLGRFVHTPGVLTAVALVGSLVLVYFGAGMIIAARTVRLERAAVTAEPAQLIVSGAAMSLANPYWAVWWLTIGLGLLLAAQQKGLTAIGVFFLGHILADFAWFAFVAYVIARGKRLLSTRAYRMIIRLCGILLICFGAYFAWYPFR